MSGTLTTYSDATRLEDLAKKKPVFSKAQYWIMKRTKKKKKGKK